MAKKTFLPPNVQNLFEGYSGGLVGQEPEEPPETPPYRPPQPFDYRRQQATGRPWYEALSQQAVLDYWKLNDPFGLYEMQVQDWIASQVTSGDLNPNDPDDRKILLDYRKQLAEAEQEFKYGIPIESLPLYKESKNFKGPYPATERKYAQFVQQKVAEYQQEQIQKGQIVKNVGGAGGRANLQQAVEQGIIPAQEAYGTGSPFEKWQRGTADQENLAAWGRTGISTRANELQQGLNAREQGLYTPAEAVAAWQEIGGGGGGEGGHDTRIADIAKRQAFQKPFILQSPLLAIEYPDLFAQYNQLPGDKTNLPFAQWASQTPDIMSKIQERQLVNLEQYGDIYPQWQEAMKTKANTPELMMPIDQWLKEDPYGMQLEEQRQKGLMNLRVRRQRTVSPGVYR